LWANSQDEEVENFVLDKFGELNYLIVGKLIWDIDFGKCLRIGIYFDDIWVIEKWYLDLKKMRNFRSQKIGDLMET
jgi:hypothetical protein